VDRLFQLARLLSIWLAITSAGLISAQSGIYRCIGDDDVPTFSDRSCSSLDARDHSLKPEVQEEPWAFITPSGNDCSRQIRDLEAWTYVALDSGDVNQLAGLYLWLDATIDSADKLMTGLKAISRRPLVTIEVEMFEQDGAQRPIRLWLDQYEPDHPGKIIRTGFSLVMNSGCWWLHGR